MEKKTARIAFRIEEPVLEALENLADARNVSISQLAREIVKRSVRAHRPNKNGFSLPAQGVSG